MKITVSGVSRSGKSTIAALIANALEREGIKARVIDDDFGFADEVHIPDARRLNAIWKARQNAEPIEVVTQEVIRTAVGKKDPEILAKAEELFRSLTPEE
jgi:uridine kinase